MSIKRTFKTHRFTFRQRGAAVFTTQNVPGADTEVQEFLRAAKTQSDVIYMVRRAAKVSRARRQFVARPKPVIPFPFGYRVERGTDAREWRWDHKIRGYRFSAFWRDDFKAEDRSARNIGLRNFDSPEAACRWFDRELPGWRRDGWTVTPLVPDSFLGESPVA